MSQQYRYPASSSGSVTISAIGITGDPAPATAIQIGGVDGSGDLQPIAVDTSGQLQVDIISSALPDGAATSDNQLTEISNLSDINTNLGSLTSSLVNAVSTPGGSVSNVLVVAGWDNTNARVLLTDSTGRLEVVIDASALPSGASTSALQVSGNSSLSSIDSKTPALGQALMAASSPVVIASDQSAIPVTGAFFQATQPVSGTFFQATQPVSGTFFQATQPVSGTFFQAIQPVSGPLTDAELRATAVPVSGAFFQATQPVSGTFFQATQPVSGTFFQAVQPVSGPLTDAELRATAVPVSGAFFQGTQPVSVATLPLPSGASTSANQATEIASLSSIDGKLPATLGQKTMANSFAVVIASDQTAIPVTGPLTDAQLRATAVPVSGSFSASVPVATTVKQAAISVGTTAVRLTHDGAAPSATRSVLVAEMDPASTATFYVGSASVTTTGATRGIPLIAAQIFTANNDAGDYYIISTVAAQTVFVLEQE